MALILLCKESATFKRLDNHRCGDCDTRALIEGPWEEAVAYATCNACGAKFKLRYFDRRLKSAMKVVEDEF